MTPAFYYNSPRQNFHVRDMFEEPDDASASACLKIGLIVLLMVFLFQQPTVVRNRVSPMCGSAASMIGTVVRTASARLGVVPEDVDDPSKKGYDKVKAANVKLLDAKGSKDAWKGLDASGKKKCAERLVAWTKSHSTGVVMLFAPWCPHCETAMGDLNAVALKHPSQSFLMVNAECVPISVISGGEESLLRCEHFPSFYVLTNGTFEYVDGPDAAVAKLAQTKEMSPKATAGGRALTVPTDEEPAPSDPFEHLFE